LEELRKALRLTHTLWGGRFNPIIPLGGFDLACSLIKVFRVDCLYCISQSVEGDAIHAEFKHLLWPAFEKDLFIEGSRGPMATFLDIYHPGRQFYETHIKDRTSPKRRGLLLRWGASDAMADVALASFGGYPEKDEIGIDYELFFQKSLMANEVNIDLRGAFPAAAHKEVTPGGLTGFELKPDHFSWGRNDPGFYYGDCHDFADLVNFWNLRASGIGVLFYDPAQDARIQEMTDQYLAVLRERPKDPSGWRDWVAIWSKSNDSEIDLTRFGTGSVLRCGISSAVWNGLNIRPPLMGFDHKWVLGSVSENGRMSVTFELPSKPFFDDVAFHMQKVIVSVNPISTGENIILKPPYFPRLNEYYGRETLFEYNGFRSERDGMGLVTEVTQNSLTLYALEVRDLVKRIFEVSGMVAKPSPAGLITLRLIEQMGGLQGCRVFKITGVRDLIRKYSPEQSFTRSGAVVAIGHLDPSSGKFRFAAFERLFVDGRAVTPQSAFDYLLKRQVFRAGLRLVCPNCELQSWIYLDDVRTITKCEFCGKEFNITSQLKDRDWAFRRSGLFGRDDHQGGAIPVALTLQQLHTAVHSDVLAYTAGTELEPAGAKIERCEADFVLLTESLPERILQVTIGECKGAGEITSDDVRKLSLVADALTQNHDCEAFIVFSKTTQFTSEEIERCRAAQGKYQRRVILLSARELEPYFMYERAKEEFIIPASAISMENMAESTQNIYFEPMLKSPKVSPDASAASAPGPIE
jgi:hypothetical protein